METNKTNLNETLITWFYEVITLTGNKDDNTTLQLLNPLPLLLI